MGPVFKGNSLFLYEIFLTKVNSENIFKFVKEYTFFLFLAWGCLRSDKVVNQWSQDGKNIQVSVPGCAQAHELLVVSKDQVGDFFVVRTEDDHGQKDGDHDAGADELGSHILQEG